jgi:hypothetical protein
MLLYVGFSEGPGSLMLVAPVLFVFMTMITRIWLELAIVLFRTADFMRITAENTAPAMRDEPRVAAPHMYGPDI